MARNHLQQRLQSFFEPVIRARGEDIAKFNAVKALRLRHGGVNAQVAGKTETYDVSLNWEGTHRSGRVRATCMCAFFDGGGFCKHLWALVIASDNTGRAPQHWPADVKLIHMASTHDLRAHRIANPEVPTEEASAAEVVANSRSWRDMFQATPVLQRNRAPDLPVYVVLKASARQPQSMDISFYQMASGTNQLRKLNLPRSGPLENVPPLVSSFLKTLDTLTSRERTAYQYRHAYLTEATTRTIPSSQLAFILKSLLDQIETFATETDLLAFLRSEPGVQPLFYAEFSHPRFEVTEIESGLRLDAKIEVPTKNAEPPVVISLNELKLFSESPSVYLYQNTMGPLASGRAQADWLAPLTQGPLEVPTPDIDAFLETVLNQAVPVEIPQKLQWPEVRVEPTARAALSHIRRADGNDFFTFDLRLNYGGRVVSYKSPAQKIVAGDEHKIYVRDLVFEQQIVNTLPLDLLTAGSKSTEASILPTKNLQAFMTATLNSGLPVDLDSKKITSSHEFAVSVKSGLDWFDVQAEADFAGTWVKFPAILEAIRKGQSFVPLADGSVAFIDETILKKIDSLTAFGDTTKDGFRFQKTQGLLLSSLLDSETRTDYDEAFMLLREKIKTFEKIEKADPPESFIGELRDYQKEGLGWLGFLDAFGLGGILADDMGLGKTIQCLAFLEARRKKSNAGLPSLLLAPKSLLSHWESEAEIFTPKLKVLVFAGSDRHAAKAKFQNYDLIVMTYQTMLRDSEVLSERPWDCVILDEAQAIKNHGALVSKATKRLQAQFRLAMTGTPIENSVQDLFSISDFVNPGFMRGRHQAIHLNLSDEARGSLSRAFKPIILRRTKSAVLKDLPPKTEQFVKVEMEDVQLKVYNQLKRYYQASLMKEIDENGIGKSKIQILAALTRLRQAALHPGLIDPQYKSVKSAKFIAAFEMLEDIIAEGHRVLIFSQFTSLLALVKDELNEQKIAFNYLDGKTTNRQKVIDEFKQGTAPVFLISLKAGGTGLNLVEADYVFLLDPWWNPSTEAQAIDRVHRIGQKHAVNAYRFIAKDTVEEKILELQKLKKQVSTEVLDGTSSLIRTLSAKDIAGMFS